MTQKSTPISIKKWEVKSANISFKIKNAGLIVPGTFKDFEGNIQFDPDNLEESSLEGSINTNTINQGEFGSTKSNNKFVTVAHYICISINIFIMNIFKVIFERSFGLS